MEVTSHFYFNDMHTTVITANNNNTLIVCVRICMCVHTNVQTFTTLQTCVEVRTASSVVSLLYIFETRFLIIWATPTDCSGTHRVPPCLHPPVTCTHECIGFHTRVRHIRVSHLNSQDLFTDPPSQSFKIATNVSPQTSMPGKECTN